MAVSGCTVSALTTRRLEGKVALITGAAMGIGEATARLFCRHGAKVVVSDVRDDRGRAVCDAIGPDAASYVHCDVSVEEDVRRAVDHAVERFGRLDVLCNNAAVLDPHRRRITQNEVADFARVLAVNLTGAFLGTKHAARVMVGGGSVINVGSVGSVVGGVATHAYVASKHGLVGLTRSAAAELGRHGVRVNCLSPFVCASELASAFLDKGGPAVEASIAGMANLKGVVLTVDDVAQAAVFLASDESRYFSGHNFVLDGGFTAVRHAFGLFHDPPTSSSSSEREPGL